MNYSFLKKFFLTAATISFVSQSAYAAPEMLNINIKTSHYMDMGQTITRIAVGNPSVATVIQLPGTASEFLVVTKENPGSTALYVWTVDDVRHEYLIVVSPEDPGQAMLIEQAINLPNVHVKMVGERILLTGTVENQYEKNYALQTARLFVDGGSESSILVGSGFDTKLETTAASDVGRDESLEMARSENKGKIIDMLQILHPTQIRLEAQIIAIDSNDAKDIGVQYNLNEESGSSGTFYFESPLSSRGTLRRPRFSSSINAKLTLLINQGKARILSRPSVVTLSGEQATIQIGGKIPYTTTNSNGSTNTQFENYGIILQFKPVVDAQNRISSVVHAEVSTVSDREYNGLPEINTRSADSVINLDSGSPMVIGGLMNSEESKSVSKIPILGDIPILGEFFKHTAKSHDKRELIIVVTPYIVNAEDNSQADMSKPMRDWYAEEQRYKESMEKVDFKEPEIKQPEETKDFKEPPRILPPSRIKYKNNHWIVDKEGKPKNNDEVVEFPLDEEPDNPFEQ